MDITGVAAIVTGGASGLGFATARRLAGEGAKVAILDLQDGAAKAAEIGARFIRTDVTDEAAMTTALDEAETAHGVARILVTCAGVAPGQRIVDREGKPHALAMFKRTLEINVTGTFNALSQFAARLIAAKMEGRKRASRS